jgi:hypothetical protein
LHTYKCYYCGTVNGLEVDYGSNNG